MRFTSEFSSKFANCAHDFNYPLESGLPESLNTYFAQIPVPVLVRRGTHEDGFTRQISGTGSPYYLFWHLGQKCDDRCATSTRRSAVPHVRQGSPVRWYTRWLNWKKPLRPSAST